MAFRNVPTVNEFSTPCPFLRITRRLFNFLDRQDFKWIDLGQELENRDPMLEYFYYVLKNVFCFPRMSTSEGVKFLRMLILASYFTSLRTRNAVLMGLEYATATQINEKVIEYWMQTLEWELGTVNDVPRLHQTSLFLFSLLSKFFPFHIFVYFNDRPDEYSVVYASDKEKEGCCVHL